MRYTDLKSHGKSRKINTHCTVCGQELTEENRYVKNRDDGTVYVFPRGKCCDKAKISKANKERYCPTTPVDVQAFQTFLCQPWR